jgi:hypothetical protein
MLAERVVIHECQLVFFGDWALVEYNPIPVIRRLRSWELVSDGL